MTTLSAYRPYWHPLATLAEVTDKPRRFTLLGEALVAYRTQHGVSVFKDLCIHRGCALSIGRLVDDRLECPYHGWQYDFTGKCVRIPALEPSQPIPSKARITAYQFREAADMLWVALEPPVAPFPDFPPGCEYGSPGLRSVIVNSYEWTVGAGRVIENFLDVAHFPFVHDGSLGDRNDTFVTPHDVEASPTMLRYTYPQLQPGDPTTGGVEELKLHFTYYAPFSAHIQRVTPRPDWSCVSLFAAPTSAATSRIFVTFVRNFDLDPASDAKYTSFVDAAMNEDAAIVQSVRPEEIPVDLREEFHIRVPDTAGLLLRRMLGRIESEANTASR